MGETDWAAVHRMESAASIMNNAAGRAEKAAHRMAYMLENGYGGNGIRLIELLETDQDALRVQLAEQDREIERFRSRDAEHVRQINQLKEKLRNTNTRFDAKAREIERLWAGLADATKKGADLAIRHANDAVEMDQLRASLKGDSQRAEKAEANLEAQQQITRNTAKAANEARGDHFDAEAALAAARKALEDLASAILRKNADGKPMHSRQGLNNIARAVLNGDSHEQI